MVVTEDFKDIEHRGARLVLERTLVANNREEAIESGLELRAGGERLGELDPQLLVVRISSEPILEIGEVVTARRLETGADWSRSTSASGTRRPSTISASSVSPRSMRSDARLVPASEWSDF